MMEYIGMMLVHERRETRRHDRREEDEFYVRFASPPPVRLLRASRRLWEFLSSRFQRGAAVGRSGGVNDSSKVVHTDPDAGAPCAVTHMSVRLRYP